MKNVFGRYGIYLLLIGVLVQGCAFDTDLVYENPVKEVEVPVVVPIQLDLEEDSIFLYRDRTVKFKFGTTEQPIFFTRVSIDGVGVDSMEADSGQIVLRTSLGLGTHELKIDLYTSSGTGSIVEQLGGEVYMFSRKWVVSVMSNRNRALTYRYMDGFMQLEGVTYKANNLIHYRLSKQGEYSSLYPIAWGPKPVLKDSCFMGEGGYYYMDAFTTEGRYEEIGRLWVPADPIVAKQELLIGNKFQMRWNKPKYYNAIRRFLTRQDNNLQKELTDMNDTVYLLKFEFGKAGTFRLEGTSKYGFSSMHETAFYYDHSVNYLMGLSYTNYNYYPITPVQVSANEFIFISNYVTFGRYSFATNVLNKSYYYPYGRSDVGHVSVSSTGKTLCGRIAEDYALINLETVTSDVHRNLSSWQAGLLLPCPVSDVETVLVNKTGGGFSVIEMSTGKVLGSMGGIDSVQEVRGLSLSAGGSYVLVKAGRIFLYRLSNGVFNRVSSWSGSADFNPYCAFDQADPSQFVYWDRNTLSVYKNLDGSLQRSYALSGNVYQSLDRYTNELLIWENQHMKVYDYVDGRLLYDIPYYYGQSDSRFNCILVNGKLVSMAGLYYAFR